MKVTEWKKLDHLGKELASLPSGGIQKGCRVKAPQSQTPQAPEEAGAGVAI